MEGFLRYDFGGLIFGRAYTWSGLFSEFYGISCCGMIVYVAYIVVWMSLLLARCSSSCVVKYGTNSHGLYRDDGLAIFKNTTGPQAERTGKEITRRFKEHGLKVTIQAT